MEINFPELLHEFSNKFCTAARARDLSAEKNGYMNLYLAKSRPS
jgi:hypothetical protein